jgi:hypothetical protein
VDPQAEPTASGPDKEHQATLPAAIVGAAVLLVTVAVLYPVFMTRATRAPDRTVVLATARPTPPARRVAINDRPVDVPKVTFTRVARTESNNEPQHTTAAQDQPRASAPSESKEVVDAVSLQESEASATGDAAELKPEPAHNPTAALNHAVGRNFNQTRIQEVADFLTDATGVAFTLDMRSLWYDQGTTRNVPVTLKAEQMTVRDFLEAVVVKQLKAAYVVRADEIVITSRKAAKQATPGRTP